MIEWCVIRFFFFFFELDSRAMCKGFKTWADVVLRFRRKVIERSNEFLSSVNGWKIN